MPNANRAVLAYRNLADLGTVSASSFVPAMPPGNVQDPHVARRWRGRTNVEALTLDLGAIVPLDVVMLAGVNLTTVGSTRIRVSTSDTAAQEDLVYDSTQAAGRVDEAYGMLVHLLQSTVSGRYVRVDLAEPSASYVEAGRLFIGLQSRFDINFAYGWTRGYVDRSRKSESRGGQTFVDRDNAYRQIEVTFEHVGVAERYGFVEEMDRINGEHEDALFVTDPTSTNLGRDSIWGLIEGLSPISQPYFDSFSKTYKIKERL